MDRSTFISPLETRYASKDMSQCLTKLKKDEIKDQADAKQMLITFKDALEILLPKLARCIDRLMKFSQKYKDLPTLGYTHLQAAQLTTVGKRACLWMTDLLSDLQDMEEVKSTLINALGTSPPVEIEVDLSDLAEEGKFERFCGAMCHQKLHSAIACCLGTLCSSVHKICSDIRILAHEKELEEPFEKTQIGSSAMAYKRNPMRSERCCSLARIPMANMLALYSGGEELARTKLPESFLCVDGILNILQNIFSNFVVYDKVIQRHIMEELPFMATEVIIMEMVKAGGDRQICHEEIRVLSQEAAKVVKLEGKSNDLMDRIKSSSYFKPIHDKLDELLDPQQFIGCCVQQVERFMEEEVSPALSHYESQLEGQVELHV